MKHASALAALLLLGACAARTPSLIEADAADRELARQLSMQLRSALTESLQNSPQEAISVCSERAPRIARDLTRGQVIIGRTALRVRNPANQPLPWQREVLEEFQARAAQGEPLAVMEYSALAGNERRYMKAIATEPMCLTCHGSDIPAELRDAIATQYPNDAATGFHVGELRGAVVIVRHQP